MWAARENSNGDKLNPILVQLNNEAPSQRWSNWYSGKWRTWYAEFALNYNRTFGDHAITAFGHRQPYPSHDPLAIQTLALPKPSGPVLTCAYKGKYLAAS